MNSKYAKYPGFAMERWRRLAAHLPTFRRRKVCLHKCATLVLVAVFIYDMYYVARSFHAKFSGSYNRLKLLC